MNLTNPSTLCLILLAIATVFLFVRTRSRLGRQHERWATEEAVAQDSSEAVKSAPSGQVPDDLARWEVQIHETARQLSAQLDAKLGLLQSLILEADRAAARLEDVLDRAHPTLLPGSQAESLRPAAHPRDVQPQLCSEPADGDEANLSAAESEPARGGDRGRRREEIYRLADYGFAPAEIARRVGSPVGEVELILSLRSAQ